MSVTLWIYQKPLEPIETEVVEVESSVLRQILPDGKGTKCKAENWEVSDATCGQFDQETHHVTRGEDGRISLTDSRIGKCKLTDKPCLRVAEHLETAIRSECERG